MKLEGEKKLGFNIAILKEIAKDYWYVLSHHDSPLTHFAHRNEQNSIYNLDEPVDYVDLRQSSISQQNQEVRSRAVGHEELQENTFLPHPQDLS